MCANHTRYSTNLDMIRLLMTLFFTDFKPGKFEKIQKNRKKT